MWGFGQEDPNTTIRECMPRTPGQHLQHLGKLGYFHHNRPSVQLLPWDSPQILHGNLGRSWQTGSLFGKTYFLCNSNFQSSSRHLYSSPEIKTNWTLSKHRSGVWLWHLNSRKTCLFQGKTDFPLCLPRVCSSNCLPLCNLERIIPSPNTNLMCPRNSSKSQIWREASRGAADRSLTPLIPFQFCGEANEIRIEGV